MAESVQFTFHHGVVSPDGSGRSEAYPHQQATAEALLSGRRVVLRAPAGAGKTLAAWLPWLAGLSQPYDLPPQMLYALPGGTFFHDLEQRMGALTQAAAKVHIGVQTEGDAFDPFFLANATLTTVDELLSVAIHRPLGLHPGLANIDAGALLGAYLVFDEFPALSSPEALVPWLGFLRRYYPVTPCLFTTSVLPRPVAVQIADLLGAELIDAADVRAGGRRSWARMPGLGAEALLRMHEGRTIVVCNTVRGAQTLYRALLRALALEARKPDVLLLHQYQFYRDRRAMEERAAQVFGPQGTGNAILITTSGIEVGSDLSADLLVTDPAPPDALIRRAGRCARFSGQIGQVVVAPITEQTPGDIYPAPPSEALLEQVCGGELRSFAEELAALDAVWTAAPAEQQPHVLRQLPDAETADAAPERLLRAGSDLPEELFRRVGVCLHRVPETVQDPFELERFSVAVSSLERGWKQWHASGCPGEWFALIPHWPRTGQRTPSWSLVDDAREFRAAARLIVLNAEAVSYDPIIGLELSPGTAYQSERLVEQHTTWSPFDQHLQAFEEHAARTLTAFEHLAPWHRYVLRHLGERWHLPVVELEQWLRLCTLWHDAGKLTADWQRAAFRWQTETMRRPVSGGVLARVDFQARRDGGYPCPDHACAGALALSRCLAVLLSSRLPLLEGTLAAICHHHGNVPMNDAELTPHPEAWAALLDVAAPLLDERLLRRMDRVGWTLHARNLPEIAPCPPATPDAWMAYSLLVRAIRLADREVALAEILS